jgi:adenylate cyclase, class 2
MNDVPPVETELKIPVENLGSVRDRLAASEAQRVHPAEREVNILLDGPGGELAATGRVLRLRRIGDRRRLTLKGPASFDGNVKSREELELEVGDLETLAAIFARLGFQPVLRYEKDRETWQIGGVTITLDHTPMGDFVELEGPPARLEDVASELALHVGSAVPGSYPGLWRAYRDRHPELELPEDMVFSP